VVEKMSSFLLTYKKCMVSKVVMKKLSHSETCLSPKDPNSIPSKGIKTSIFIFSRGEFVMIRGPSGGGKTTLLNLIGTIDSPSDGEL
jgi:ABC-type nitrate/sulfonate/bicarbonate transport system ATPase subunit